VSLAALEVVANRRRTSLLGPEWLREMDELGEWLGREVLRKPRPRPPPIVQTISSFPKVVSALTAEGFDPSRIEERELAGVVGNLAPLPGAVLWDERLEPSGLLEWLPPQLLSTPEAFARLPASRKLQRFGRGWLMDAGARRVLASAPAGAELWVVHDVSDFLEAASYWSETDERERGVLGVVDGRWTPSLCRCIPEGAAVLVTPGPAAQAVLASTRARGLPARPWRPGSTGERRSA
jgi:hypothetical protein